VTFSAGIAIVSPELALAIASRSDPARVSLPFGDVDRGGVRGCRRDQQRAAARQAER
jgi:hypothetical protein